MTLTGRVFFVRIAVGSDHGGFELKSILTKELMDRGYEILDLGTTDGVTAVDYPDFGAGVAHAVIDDRAECGIAICGTGIGVAIAANKVRGVRAAVVHDVTTAQLAKEHNHANVLCLGARVIGTQVAIDAVLAWLKQSPSEGRHLPRIEKLRMLDEHTDANERP